MLYLESRGQRVWYMYQLAASHVVAFSGSQVCGVTLWSEVCEAMHVHTLSPQQGFHIPFRSVRWSQV